MLTSGKRRRPLTPRFCLLAPALLALACNRAAAANDDVDVTIDQAAIIRLERPAAEIIVGNPSIADVAVQSGKVLVVTGKSYGRTNLIVIDSDGKQVTNRALSVTEPGKGYVVVHRGTSPFTYYCAPNCTPSLTVGDNPDWFDAIQKEVQSKQTMGQASAEGGTSGAQ
ncbi:MAG: pilus assembly protein N-terminal domain-containing protein [Methyloceanibacter sp.]